MNSGPLLLRNRQQWETPPLLMQLAKQEARKQETRKILSREISCHSSRGFEGKIFGTQASTHCQRRLLCILLNLKVLQILVARVILGFYLFFLYFFLLFSFIFVIFVIVGLHTGWYLKLVNGLSDCACSCFSCHSFERN